MSYSFPLATEELFETLLKNPHVRIERIVSHGHSSPPGFWYDQEMNEWVIVLKGRGRLLFEGSGSIVEMKAGDYVEIPAHTRHRVEWTDPDEDTVWLAVYY
jgi:cupin 2 domain-containing protein